MTVSPPRFGSCLTWSSGWGSGLTQPFWDDGMEEGVTHNTDGNHFSTHNKPNEHMPHFMHRYREQLHDAPPKYSFQPVTFLAGIRGSVVPSDRR